MGLRFFYTFATRKWPRVNTPDTSTPTRSSFFNFFPKTKTPDPTEPPPINRKTPETDLITMKSDARKRFINLTT
jgi:hypothetical protein